MEEKEVKEQPAQQAEKAKTKKKDNNLQKKIDELSDKLSREHDDYLRLMAEFDTYRRRTAEEKLSLVSSAAADTIKGLLPVLDDCESALKILEGSSDAAAREGTQLIYNKLMEYLKTRGLTVIEAKGQKFDTDYHEALTQVPAPSEDLKGTVIDVFQTGYMLNGKILRYAKVIVGA
jgi:molecular chaperone GrpE